MLLCSRSQHSCGHHLAAVQHKPLLSVTEMCCGRSWPAGSDSASRRSREGWSGGVLDAAAEDRMQDAPSEEPQRPHAAGSVQTGENIQVNLLFSEILIKKTLRSKPLCFNTPPCLYTIQLLLQFSLGVVLLMATLSIFLQTSAAHQTTESSH